MDKGNVDNKPVTKLCLFQSLRWYPSRRLSTAVVCLPSASDHGVQHERPPPSAISKASDPPMAALSAKVFDPGRMSSTKRSLEFVCRRRVLRWSEARYFTRPSRNGSRVIPNTHSAPHTSKVPHGVVLKQRPPCDLNSTSKLRLDGAWGYHQKRAPPPSRDRKGRGVSCLPLLVY